MAAEEDKKFDAALGGFLARDLRVRSGHLHCPESDVLAAYHERSLLPEEMNSWKEHIVGCTRCQAILAELEATDSIPLQAAETEKEEVMRASVAKPVAEPIRARKAAPAAFPQKSHASWPSRVLRWQWLAPAGALAAGLLVWVAWRESRPLPLAPPSEVNVAKVEPQAAPGASAPPAARQALESKSLDQFANLSKDQQTIDGATAAKIAQESRNLKPLEKLNSRTRAAVSTPSTVTEKESGARQDAARDSSLAADRIQNQPALDAKTGVAGGAAGGLSEPVQVQARGAGAPAQNSLNEQKISGPSPLKQAEQAKKNKSESAALAYERLAQPPVPAPAASTAFSDAASMEIAGVLSPHLITAPGGEVIWRAGHAGLVAFSRDRGTSWLRQISGVLVDLTSGSAPSDKVCWIVGRAGTILVTTDAGSHWAIVHSPLDEDLGGVRATDALHATIWNSSSTKTFETSNGGLTWKLASPQ